MKHPVEMLANLLPFLVDSGSSQCAIFSGSSIFSILYPSEDLERLRLVWDAPRLFRLRFSASRDLDIDLDLGALGGNSIEKFGLTLVLKNNWRFHFDSVTCPEEPGGQFN